MCGIVAYVGPQQAYPILIKGLYRLEYRGYDSAGVAILNDEIQLYKNKKQSDDFSGPVFSIWGLMESFLQKKTI